jgi:glycerol-3-phosphate acyltransferase PlsX
MGGDYAPEEIVKGAVRSAQKGDIEIFLVGPTSILEKELAKYKFANGSSIHVVEASAVIKENESPVVVVRNKPDCSVAVAAKMVQSGEADALVSAGSSAAAAVSAIQFIGMVEGISRPAIVGREAYSALKNSGLNFIGNIEGNDILNGKANVIVCDGFVGNVLLKFYESVGPQARDWTEQKLKKYPFSGIVVKLLFNKLFPATKISSETEKRGGGILWGVDGIVRIAHGASRAPRITNAIESAKEAVKAGVIEDLKSELAKFNQGGKL